MCIIKTQQYACRCFKDPLAPIEICQVARLVFSPAQCLPYSPPPTPTPTPTPSPAPPLLSPESIALPPSSEISSQLSSRWSQIPVLLPSTGLPQVPSLSGVSQVLVLPDFSLQPLPQPHKSDDIHSGGWVDRKEWAEEEKRELKPWVARGRSMCISCCPAKVYTGEMGELYRNYVGVVLGEFVFLIVTFHRVKCLYFRGFWCLEVEGLERWRVEESWRRANKNHRAIPPQLRKSLRTQRRRIEYRFRQIEAITSSLSSSSAYVSPKTTLAPRNSQS